MALSVETSNRMFAGAVAGLISGIPLGLVLCVGMAVIQGQPWLPISLLASLILGESALLPTAGRAAMVVGIAAHLVLSVGLGVLFSLVSLAHSWRRMFIHCLIFGVGLSAALQYIVFPTGVDLAWAIRMPPGLFIFASLIFSLGLMLILPFERLLFRRIEDRRPLAEVIELKPSVEKSEPRKAA